MKSESRTETLLDISNPTSLVSLKWTDRQETSLEAIKGFKNLKELDLTGNRLRTPVPALLSLKYLQKLTLARNEVSTMWELPEQLEFLSLAENHVEEWRAGLSNLRSLDLSHNDFRSLSTLSHFPHLSSLYLSHNRLMELCPLSCLPQLLELDLTYNLLSAAVLAELCLHPCLAAVGVKGNPGAEELKVTENWEVDADTVMFRNIERLKSLPTSRFRRKIKEKKVAKHVRYEIPEEALSSSSVTYSELDLVEEPPAPVQPKQGYDVLRPSRAEELWEDLISECGLKVEGDKEERYEAAKKLLIERERERLELQTKCASLNSQLEAIGEQHQCHCADLESSLLHLHLSYQSHLDSLRKDLSDLSDLKELKSPDEDFSLVYEFQSMREVQEAAVGDEFRLQGERQRTKMSLSDSKRMEEDRYEKTFAKQLDNGKARVPRFVGEFVERLKRSNSRLKDKLLKAKAQRDHCARAIRLLQSHPN
jgi:hypothetical protein